MARKGNYILNSRQAEHEAHAVLRELVACKDLKDRITKLDDPMNWKRPEGLDALEEEYARRKQAAWAAARAIVDRTHSEPKACPYCISDNPAIRSAYYDQTCEGCVKRMGQP